MSNIRKFKSNEEPKEVKKPFKFVNIKADISFDDVAESDNTFLFFNGNGELPNAMLPTDNPFDVTIDYLNKTSTVADQDQHIDDIQVAFVDKYNTAMQQNSWIVFENGMKKFLSNFIDESDIEKNEIIKLYNGIICSCIYHNDLFGDKKFEQLPDISDPNYPEILFDNNIRCSSYFLSAACHFYKNLINNIIRDSELCKSITLTCAQSDNIDTGLIPESSYTAYATSILNQLAVEDIYKLQDIVCILGSQIIFEYERSIAKYIASKK